MYYLLDGEGIVEGGAHPADGAVALEVEETPLLRLLQEPLL